MQTPLKTICFILTAGLLLTGCFKDPPVIPQPEAPDLQIDSLKVLAATIPAADYTDMTFVNGQTGFAVSAEGDIIKTADTGLHWIKLPFSAGAYLHRIRFVSANTGFIIGGADTIPSGFLLKTTDGGLTWQRIILHTPFPGSPAAMHFTDASTGFIAGKQFLKKTTDGGITWTDVPAAAEDFTDVRFLDKQKGFATARSGKYFKTVNGGNNWEVAQITTTAQLGEIVTTPSKMYVRVGNGAMTDLETGLHAFTVPASVLRMLFLSETKAVGVGQHYEAGFWPYGDIFLTSTLWHANLSRRFEPGQAINFRAVAKATDHKVVMLGNGLLQTTVVSLSY